MVPLTFHDVRVLRLASEDPEGRLFFSIAEDGSILLAGAGGGPPLPAEDAFPRLEELGLLSRDVSRSFVLTPLGWDALTLRTEDRPGA